MLHDGAREAVVVLGASAFDSGNCSLHVYNRTPPNARHRAGLRRTHAKRRAWRGMP